MGHVALAILSGQRHRDPLDAERGVALPRGGKDIAQSPINLCITRGEPPGRCSQNIARVQNGIACRIGVNETSTGIDEEHARAEPIERVNECRDFGGLELEHPADHDGTPDVRRDQPHLLARTIVHDAISLVAKDSEYGRTDRGPLNDRAQEIDKTLRLGPLKV